MLSDSDAPMSDAHIPGPAAPNSDATNSQMPNSNLPNGTSPNSHTPGQINLLLPTLRRDPPILLLILYTRRAITTASNQNIPPILRTLPRLAIYESYIHRISELLRSQFPAVPLIQVDIDLGYPYPGLDHRLRACFGGTVREMIFQVGATEACSWGQGPRVIRELIRVYKVFPRGREGI
jgi:hypothetical protein